MPAGAVESGYVVDSHCVSEAIEKLLSAADIRVKHVKLVLDGKLVVCRVDPCNESDEKSVRADATDRMRRYIVFGGRPVVLGQTLQAAVRSSDNRSWLLNAATLADLLDGQVAVAKRAGLTVTRAEPALTAIGRMMLDADTEEEAKIVLVSRDDGCEFGVVRQDGLVFSHSLLIRADAPDYGARLHSTIEMLRNYHERHANGREPIRRMLCCGSLASVGRPLDSLGGDEVCSEPLDPGEFARVMSIDGDETASRAERAEQASVIAVALADMDTDAKLGHLSLLPTQQSGSRIRRLAHWLVPIAATLLVWAGLTTVEAVVNSRADNFARQLEKPSIEMLESNRLRRLDSELKRRCEEIRLLSDAAGSDAGAAFIQDIPTCMPDDIWLERLILSSDTACKVYGLATAEEAAFTFARILGRSPTVAGVKIGDIRRRHRGEHELAAFSIDVKLTSEAAEASRRGS